MPEHNLRCLFRPQSYGMENYHLTPVVTKNTYQQREVMKLMKMENNSNQKGVGWPGPYLTCNMCIGGLSLELIFKQQHP